ncbi:SDR family NAD(P)-dependent oxidoreductase [Salipiger bermudensis]|uniref:SDR family NAD(P)-dependent oxidoreductase n=1 Tax=Salipiger bermudensis TaxID=344736 RepID=UPI001CD1AA9E|nr:SDR family NAD(P)-dependent oxidoreductase [Salipiger bermudensis]MCA0960568.1 SDR family NAD(P)-dependent oxidoreductase [Salipiger bermudensis]
MSSTRSQDSPPAQTRALVIGASGGIGSALCAALSEGGVEVTGLSRSADGIDFADPASVSARLEALSGPFRTIVVASGMLAPEGARPEKSLAEIDAGRMAEVMAANAIGPAQVLRHVPRLLPREGRSVVGVLTARVGSIGDNRLGGWYSYRASKAAANQIVHTAAIEIARTHPGAIVVALHPGTVATEFTSAYPAHRKLAPAEAARNLLGVLDGLAPEQTGQFFDWAAAPVPW